VTPVSLVIFDCDGVLIDSEILAGNVLNDGLIRLGLSSTVAECHAKYRGRAFADCLREIEASLGRSVPDGWVDGLRAAMLDGRAGGIPAMPHAREALTRLAQHGVSLCVASSSNRPYLERMLGTTELLPIFGGNLFSASMVARGKPAPDLFLHAAQTMGHAPDACLVVEDSVPGVKAAVAARMRVLGYAGDAHTDAAALVREGARLIHDLREVIREVSGREDS
jgi:HAD superfamily hydrolase (TIGR01509 family)